jgi:predicted Zn-dependent protease
MIKLIKIISLTMLACALFGCGAPSAPTQHNRGLDIDQSGRTNANLVKKHVSYSSKIDEYVNRIAKRIVVVSDQPDSNYVFKVVVSPTAGITYDPETNSILVSSALLAQLRDEAQLAAVLSLTIAKYSQQSDPDRNTLNNLYQAGYDPKALVELQEQYVISEGTQYPWFGTMYTYPLSPNIVRNNQAVVNTLPSGLLRGDEAYRKAIS